VSRRTKQDWLRGGFEVLTHQGSDALTVENLVTHMRVTKGSFYHHFGSLAQFRTELIAFLERSGFSDVIDPIPAHLPAAQQLALVTADLSRRDPVYDKAVRLWGERDPEAAALVARVDAARLTYLTGLFTDLTGHPNQGRLFARLAYAFYLGTAQIQPRIMGQEYSDMIALLTRLLPQERP